ncbi:MAG: type II toxin-antitoxin system Phd/YefM family antitoxin [Candidatus Limnocylindrales bacterium]
MSEGEAALARVGVRELRQNLSVYLDRVKAGETLEVTEHGRTVARLGPSPAPLASALERLLAAGHARPAPADLLAMAPPDAVALPPGVTSVTEVLLRLRDEERW